jgi:hypothetical protein
MTHLQQSRFFRAERGTLSYSALVPAAAFPHNAAQTFGLWPPNEPIQIKKGSEQMNSCEDCQESLAGSELTLPWENGDNSYSYVACRRCRLQKVVYGFGENV